MTELVQVKSPDWGPQICKGLKELYDEKIGCNVAIYGSDGGILDGHACVLMAVSPTLKTWLAGDPIQGCHSVEIDTITCDTWRLLLEFMYTGKVTVDKDVVHEVLDAAEKLSMNHLIEACKMATTPSPKTVGKDTSHMPIINSEGDNHEEKATDLSQQLAEKFVEKTPSKAISASGDQPLDLTKIMTKPLEGVVVKTEMTTPEQLISSGKLPLPPPIPPNADPQMQAVMAMYYNQMIQYSMLAQNLKNGGGKDRMPNLPPAPQLPPGFQIPTPQSIAQSLPPPPVSTMMPMMNLPPPQQQFMPQQVDMSMQDGRQRKFPCSICGMLFFTRHVKEQHELTHTNLKPYSCNICGFRARQKAVIWRHKKNRHPEADSSVSMDALTTSMPSSPEAVEDDEQSNVSSNTSIGRIVPSPESSQPGLSMSQIPVPHPAATLNTFSAMNTIPTPSLTRPLSSITTTKPMVPVDPSKPYVCETCGRGFKNKYILSQHSMIHSNVRRYACDICGFRAKQMSVIYNHKRNKHWGKKGDQPELNHGFSGAANQNDAFQAFSPVNMSTKPAITPSNEVKTPQDAINTNDLEGNLKQIEQEVQLAKHTAAGYQCRLCGRCLKTKMILQEHIMTHYNIRRYPCAYCNYRAKQRAGLYNHMKVKHKGLRPIRPAVHKRTPIFTSQMVNKPNPFNPSRRKYMCRTCGKSFRIKHVLEQHELIHLNIKRYSCKYCGFKGKQKSVIYRHNQLKHIGQKARVLDLLKPRFGIPEKITPPLPNQDVSPVKEFDHEEPTPQDLSKRQEEIKNKLNREPIVIQPIDFPMEAQDLSILTNKLKSQIVTQQKQLPTMANNFTPKLMGTNLVYAVSLPGQQTSPAKITMSQTPPPVMVLNKNGDNPPALFPSYGTPDKPHRCKVCGRCFRLRHVMEQHELTHSNFRKYMCDICGFRAKQKAVIYRHKKVKHPGHPGAGRVALVPEVMGLDNSSQQQNDMPPQLVPVNKQLSPSNNPELAHNNNKSMPAISRIGTPLNGIAKYTYRDHHYNDDDDDERPSPTGSVDPSPLSGMGWYLPPDKDDSEEEEMSEFSTGESLSTNMAMGLPSMVPSTHALNLSLPPMAPLSPEQHSPTDDIDKKYSCQVCGRSFKHRHVLEQHYITHTGLRPYKCEFCDFCARQKASLWRHKQKHLVSGTLVHQ